MLRFTKRADYGLMAIHCMAVHEDGGAVSAKRIAEEFAIPQELLAKILQRLAKQQTRPIVGRREIDRLAPERDRARPHGVACQGVDAK